jgi:pimeloyl-ACP methyl ester carboxylesterase
MDRSAVAARAPRSLARRIVRWLLLLLVAAAAGLLLLLSTAPFMPELSWEQEQQLRRSAYFAPSGAVAVLAGGPQDAPRVIFVHGSPGAAADWAEFLLDAPSGREAVAIDRPGFGRSDPYGAVPSLAEQAEALVPLLVQRGGHWPIVVGHSMGAPVAAWLAAEHPGEVEGLVLLAGALDPALEEWRWFNRAATLLSPLLARPLRNSNEEMRALRGELEALAPELRRIRGPVVVVHGRRDALVPFAEVDYARRMFPAARLRVIELPEGDHFLPWDATDTVRQAIASLTGS